jgi:hypothetical protein
MANLVFRYKTYIFQVMQMWYDVTTRIHAKLSLTYYTHQFITYIYKVFKYDIETLVFSGSMNS